MASSGTAPPLISVLLPTRGRPELAKLFLDSLARTCHAPASLEVVPYLDDDDVASVGIGDARLSVRSIVGPSATMGAMNRSCLDHAAGDIVFLANDDILVRTDGWDAEIRNVHTRFPDGIYLSWPNDEFASYRMSTFPIVSRRTCDVLQQPFSPAYRSAFIDYELFDIFTRLRRLGHDRLVYLPQVVFEHRHHRSGKRPVDDTTRRRPRFEDDMTFVARRHVRQRAAERLAAFIEERTLPPPITQEPAQAPAHAVAAIARYASAFLGDAGLPVGRRAYLFVWYCGRYLAARANFG